MNILAERCNLAKSVKDRYGDDTWIYQKMSVPCITAPVSSTEKEERGLAVAQTYLFVTQDRTIPFAAGAAWAIEWNGRWWNLKGNLGDVTVRGRVHHREGIMALMPSAPVNVLPVGSTPP